MNTGTKLRTVLVIATSLNTALMATDLTGFSNATVDLIYKIVSIALNFVIVGISTYFNNDYTEVAKVNTQLMRLQKKDELFDEYFEEEEDHE